MSSSTGRNDPCPCGSGRKYKRCCLAKDEAISQEAAGQREPFVDGELDEPGFDGDDFDADDFDDSDFDGAPPDPTARDVGAITRVRYTHGSVQRLADIRRGRGLHIVQWEAPQIPASVLESIDREGAGALDRRWGEIGPGPPIEVDAIDVETGFDNFRIEVLNRARLSADTGQEQIRQLHRVCDALRAAALSGTPPPRSLPIQELRAGLARTLKQRRSQSGTCVLCGDTVSRTTAARHFAGCAPAHDPDTGRDRQFLRLRVTAPGDPAYWLDIEAGIDAKLAAVDGLLRGLWLECCGHMSQFRIGSRQYVSHDAGAGGGIESIFSRLGRPTRVQRTMSVTLRDALPPPGERFDYDYDFGSTTLLRISVADERVGRAARSRVRLLARNQPVVWPCAVCGKAAAVVCTTCRDEQEPAFMCDRHRSHHSCGEDECLRPVVNSPRMGVCGYTGDA